MRRKCKTRSREQLQRFCDSKCAVCGNRHGNHPPVAIEVEQLTPVTPPAGVVSAISRNLLSPARSVGKRPHDHLIYARFVGDVGERIDCALELHGRWPWQRSAARSSPVPNVSTFTETGFAMPIA